MRIALVNLGALVFFSKNVHALERDYQYLDGVHDDSSANWARATRGFRSDHHFGIGIGHESNVWSGRTGPKVSLSRVSTQGEIVKLGYSFHLPVGAGFGYSLGSSLGMTFGEKHLEDFEIKRTIILPGLDIGLVWNINDLWRLSFVYTFGWQRIDTLNLRNGHQSSKISATGDGQSLNLAFDYFFELSKAVRLEFEEVSASYSSIDVIELDKKGKSIQIGFLKHLI